MPRTALAADPFVTLHDPGFDHPEQPGRYHAVMEGLRAAHLLPSMLALTVQPVDNSLLELVHTPEYVALVEREVSSHHFMLSTGDTVINKHSAQVARLAAGCAVAGVDAVFDKQTDNAFCVCRPPGHHASSNIGMGFCLFNNVAIAARHAQRKWGAERVLIVDWDVHHGNGTQDIFYSDGSVLFFSTHQHPWYPGTGEASETGEGKGAGLTINCPLPAGTGKQLLFDAVEKSLMPAAERFHPDLILISAGFDSRIGDPLGRFLLTDGDFREFTFRLMDLADRFCDGRLVSVLEGGYDLEGLGKAATAHVRALLSAHMH
jgi:acetoin utilization deacetylase AcuC-like enzyme